VYNPYNMGTPETFDFTITTTGPGIDKTWVFPAVLGGVEDFVANGAIELGGEVDASLTVTDAGGVLNFALALHGPLGVAEAFDLSEHVTEALEEEFAALAVGTGKTFAVKLVITKAA